MDLSQLIENIINMLNIKNSPNNLFYKECINYITNPLKINNFIETHEMTNNYILEPMRLYINSNINKYVCFIADISIFEKPIGNILKKESVYRNLNILSIKARNNLLRQLHVIETDKLDNFFENNVVTRYYSQIDKIVFFIIEKENKNIVNMIDNKNLIQIKKIVSLCLFMGDETLYFLEKQDLDRFINYMKSNNKYVIKSVNMFKKTYSLCKELDPDIYDRMIIFSGFVLHTLGTTYTSDADVIFWAQDMKIEDLENVKILFKRNNINDFFIYDRNSSKTIDNLIANPNKHYHFLGIKILCIEKHLTRLYENASPAAFVDLIMLNKINKIHIDPCYPTLSFKNEIFTVYTKQMIEKKLQTTQKYLKEWHNINYSLNELRELIKHIK